ncbi:MAG: hypothetical protein HY673_12540 [Chloroflexi bacterium]|nr:hypothetical protein [Chloroflexota bacterium]
MKTPLAILLGTAVLLAATLSPACLFWQEEPATANEKMLREVEAAQREVTFPITAPGYLPDGFTYRGMYYAPDNIPVFQERHTKVSMTFGSRDGYFMELRETDVPTNISDIPGLIPVRFKKQVKGVLVVVKEGTTIPRKVGNEYVSVPEITVDWNHKGISFWLSTPDIEWSGLEKMVASMIR